MAEQRTRRASDPAETPNDSAAADATRAQVEAESKTTPRTEADQAAPRADAPETRAALAASAPRRRRSATTSANGTSGRSAGTTPRTRSTGTSRRSTRSASAPGAEAAPSAESAAPKTTRPSRRRTAATAASTTDAGTQSSPASAAESASPPTPAGGSQAQPTDRPAPDTRQASSPISAERVPSTADRLLGGTASGQALPLARRLYQAVRSAPRGILAALGVIGAILLWRIWR